MFEELAFSLPMYFEGLWMGYKTPGTASRGAPDASRTASRALKSLPRGPRASTRLHDAPKRFKEVQNTPSEAPPRAP